MNYKDSILIKKITTDNREQYKADSPYNTISRIRDIIKKLEIFVTEQDFYSFDNNIFSCRTIIDNVGFRKHNLGTNGKGLSAEFALASSYGELMERLQAGFLFRKNETREAIWYFMKDDFNFKKDDPAQFAIQLLNQLPPFFVTHVLNSIRRYSVVLKKFQYQ